AVSGDHAGGAGQIGGNGKGETGNVERTADRSARGGPAGAAGLRGRRVPPRGGGRGCGAGDPLRAGDATGLWDRRHSRGAPLGECPAAGGGPRSRAGGGSGRTGHRDGRVPRRPAEGVSHGESRGAGATPSGRAWRRSKGGGRGAPGGRGPGGPG